MRIFQVIRATTNSSVPENKTWLKNLYEPLLELGHDVYLFNAEMGKKALIRKSSKLRIQFSRKLLEAFKKEHKKKRFDLFFAYLMDGMVETFVIDEIKRSGVLTCNFSCNNIHQFYLVKGLSSHFDYCLHAEKYARKSFLEVGANPLWWPMASNPKYFKPLKMTRQFDASFVGENYALRLKYIQYLLRNGIDVHAFGPRWKSGSSVGWRAFVKHYLLLVGTLAAFGQRNKLAASAKLFEHDFRCNIAVEFPNNIHPPVSDEELIALYSKSIISLGFLEVYYNHDSSGILTQHLHLREFEAPMCGALYFTGYTDELSEMFDVDKEVIVYRNEYELLDKVKYFLNHPKECDKVRLAARKRALHEHTYHHRFKTLFKQIGL